MASFIPVSLLKPSSNSLSEGFDKKPDSQNALISVSKTRDS